MYYINSNKLPLEINYYLQDHKLNELPLFNLYNQGSNA